MATVVVGYVPKPEGEAAVDRALDEARLRRWDLLVIISSRRRDDDPAPEVDRLRTRLRESGVDAQVREVTGGFDAAEDIVDAVDEHDMIVIGVRRRTPLGKLILGSSAQRILLDAPCPVLTVKPASGGRS